MIQLDDLSEPGSEGLIAVPVDDEWLLTWAWNLGGLIVLPEAGSDEDFSIQLTHRHIAKLLDVAELRAQVERLRERLAEQSVDEAAAMIWNNAEFHRDTWRDASDWHWLRGLLEEVAELCLALAGLHRHWMTTRADTIEWELRQIGGIVLNWLRRRS